MWIMLTTKLPTQPSPPKMSIFWSTPWPDDKFAPQQAKDFLKQQKPSFVMDDEGCTLPKHLQLMKATAELSSYTYGPSLMGREPNWVAARAIIYKGEQVRVFPHEFSVPAAPNLAMYFGLTDYDASHELVPEGVASETLVTQVLEGVLKEVYDAALLDGCNHQQAMAMALGVDVSELGTDGPEQGSLPPPMGWYRCKREYAEYYCNEEEMAE